MAKGTDSQSFPCRRVWPRVRGVQRGPEQSVKQIWPEEKPPRLGKIIPLDVPGCDPWEPVLGPGLLPVLLGFSCDLPLSPAFGPGQLVPGCHRISVPCRDTVDSDQFKREEDFYYTEVQMKGEAAAAGGPTADPAPTPSVTSPPLTILPPPPPPKAQSSGPDHPGLESYLPSGALSKSAPGSFWHIQADHAYQVWGPPRELSLGTRRAFSVCHWSA